MLDVHPPDHPVHGVRDFFLHLLTITVGLLIALSLESLVEFFHHRHLVHEADANLRHEIEDNRKDLQIMLDAIPAEQANYKALLAFFEARATGRPATIHSVSVGFKLMSAQDASWQTANATGALGYMEYSHVQRYAAAYQLQRKLDAMQDALLPPLIGTLAVFSAGDPEKMSQADATQALHSLREVIAHAETLREIGSDTGRLYDEALKAEP